MFYLDDGREMFQIVLDARNIIGPREATERDRADHPGEYAGFRRSIDDAPVDSSKRLPTDGPSGFRRSGELGGRLVQQLYALANEEGQELARSFECEEALNSEQTFTTTATEVQGCNPRRT